MPNLKKYIYIYIIASFGTTLLRNFVSLIFSTNNSFVTASLRNFVNSIFSINNLWIYLATWLMKEIRKNLLHLITSSLYCCIQQLATHRCLLVHTASSKRPYMLHSINFHNQQTVELTNNLTLFAPQHKLLNKKHCRYRWHLDILHNISIKARMLQSITTT